MHSASASAAIRASNEGLEHRTQQVRLGTLEVLGQEPGRVDTGVGGHRDDLLQSGFCRSSEGSRGDRLPRPHDTLVDQDLVHHDHGLTCLVFAGQGARARRGRRRSRFLDTTAKAWMARAKPDSRRISERQLDAPLGKVNERNEFASRPRCSVSPVMALPARVGICVIVHASVGSSVTSIGTVGASAAVTRNEPLSRAARGDQRPRLRRPSSTTVRSNDAGTVVAKGYVGECRDNIELRHPDTTPSRYTLTQEQLDRWLDAHPTLRWDIVPFLHWAVAPPPDRRHARACAWAKLAQTSWTDYLAACQPPNLPVSCDSPV